MFQAEYRKIIEIYFLDQTSYRLENMSKLFLFRGQQKIVEKYNI